MDMKIHGGMILAGETEELEGKPVPVPLPPPVSILILSLPAGTCKPTSGLFIGQFLSESLSAPCHFSFL
jgi:hypothetical protein